MACKKKTLDWLSLVDVHSDAWLLVIAFYFGARFGFDKVDRYFILWPYFLFEVNLSWWKITKHLNPACLIYLSQWFSSFLHVSHSLMIWICNVGNGFSTWSMNCQQYLKFLLVQQISKLRRSLQFQTTVVASLNPTLR